MTIHSLVSEFASLDAQAFGRWLECADELRTIWQDADPTDCPLSYNETASMSFLCCAAGRAGFLAMADFAADKVVGAGRCDLWLSNSTSEWAFEFKQDICEWPSVSQTRRSWDQAIECANCLMVEADVTRFAGLLLTDYRLEDRSQSAEWLDIQSRFAKENATLAWQLRASPEAGGVNAVIMLKLFD